VRSHRLRAAAGAASAEIVTGAVLHWDFGDTNCWNRTNSTVTDLSGNGHNSSIQNYNSANQSHSYNSNKGGYLEASHSSGATLGMSGLANGPYHNNPLFFRGTAFSNTNFWGSTSNNQPYTLEFISDLTLPTNRQTSRFGQSVGIFASATPTSSALYDFATISTQSGTSVRHVMSLIINADGSGSGCEISEIGFQTGDATTANTTYLDIPNLTYPYNNPGDTTGWQQIIVTWNQSNGTTFYRNGSLLYGPITNTANYKMEASSLFSCDEFWFTAQGGWGVIRGYDKELTAAEVLGQYNAQKVRFGI
tara:strand:+ start:490 stop:1407 length:918 start_codon:yes stop_codon:yes gene_type:complete